MPLFTPIIPGFDRGSLLNKKVATWCNEYVLRQAWEIWVGDIAPNGMLASLIDRLQQEARG